MNNDRNPVPVISTIRKVVKEARLREKNEGGVKPLSPLKQLKPLKPLRT